MLARRPKVLVATTVHWASTTRLCLALADGGFDVAVAAPADHGTRNLNLPAIVAHYDCAPEPGATSAIAKAIEAWSPDLVIPGDDLALASLHELSARAARGEGKKPRRLLKLIARSLGDHRSFIVARKKSALVDFARAEGLLVPDTTVIRDLDDLRSQLAARPLPQVLKLDGYSGGVGVRIVRSMRDGERGFLDLIAISAWPAAIRQAGARLSVGPIVRRWRREIPTITVQRFVPGRPANRAVACWNGEILAGISVEALQTIDETGPATVVRIIENREMDEAVAHLVRRLALSGLVGFDFILDSMTGRPVLIEMNSRPTPVCHLFFDEATDLIGSLCAKLAGPKRQKMGRSARRDIIAFFPQEFWRDPCSEYLQTSYHDVPWHEPAFVAAYARPVRQHARRWTDAVAEHVRFVAARFGQKDGAAVSSKSLHGALARPESAASQRAKIASLEGPEACGVLWREEWR
jgi:hypothetical protein